MLRGEYESATRDHSNHRGKNPSSDEDGDRPWVIFRDGRGFHPDIEFLSEAHSASLEPSAVRTGNADSNGGGDERTAAMDDVNRVSGSPRWRCERSAWPDPLRVTF